MDWLRVIFVCGLIMIHVAAIFDPYPITAVKGRTSFTLVLFATFLHEWRLAILFIVSGAGSYFVLGFLTGRQFIRMRFKRIIIPLVMGTFLIVPIHLYFWQFRGNPGYNKSYLEFYSTIMRRFFFEGIFGTMRESLHWAHLWFLFYLFVSSLIALPLFLYLRRGNGQRLIPIWADFFSKPWRIFLLSLPLVLVEVTMSPIWTSARAIIIGDWATFTMYTILFVYGFLIFSNDKFRETIEAHRWFALIAGIITSLAYLMIVFVLRPPRHGYNPGYLLFMALRGFNVWFWCVTVLGFASRRLRFDHKLLPYLNEAVYPVYVVHLPIATIIAYYVIRVRMPSLVQFAIIVILTIAVAMLIFELVRRTKVTRFLFGLKTKKPKREQTPATETAATPAAPPA